MIIESRSSWYTIHSFNSFCLEQKRSIFLFEKKETIKTNKQTRNDALQYIISLKCQL